MLISEQDKLWAEQFLDKMKTKLSKTAEEVGARFPTETLPDGTYKFDSEPPYRNWVNGFWPGIMWLMYLATKEDKYKTIAEKCEEKLDIAIDDFVSLHHDVGFMWLPSAVANYRITGNARSRVRGLHVASTLAARFNPVGNFIRAWNYWGKEDNITRAIVDCMMNVPILFWASAETEGTDQRFANIAKLHIATVMKHFIRPDGSSEHMVVFDPQTGEPMKKPGGQGYSEGSSWSRGQSWALYGFTIAYMHAKDQAYLDVAKKCAHYFIANLDDNFLPPIDFRQPAEPHLLDTSAGAVAACALIELSKLVPEGEGEMYMRWAIRLLKGLETQCDFTDKTPSILQESAGAYHGEQNHHKSLIYGDYYLLEALMKLHGNTVFFW